MTMKVTDQTHKTINIVVVHRCLIGIQPTGDTLALTFQMTTEPTVVDLRERLTLYLMLQSRMFRMVLPADASPKDGVLRLSIEDDTIQVKKGSLERSLLHFSKFWLQN